MWYFLLKSIIIIELVYNLIKDCCAISMIMPDEFQQVCVLHI